MTEEVRPEVAALYEELRVRFRDVLPPDAESILKALNLAGWYLTRDQKDVADTLADDEETRKAWGSW